MRVVLLILSSLFFIGCADRKTLVRSNATQSATLPTQAATQPTNRDAFLALDEIEPRPVLPKARTTDPTTRPSLDAIALYAQARDAQLQNQRFSAISLLERAVQLDPDSFALRYALGEVYLDNAGFVDKSIQAFESAAAINPDDLQVHLQLGRQYLNKGNVDKGITELRLARLSSEYESDEEQSAVVNFFLARALQQKGYDRAAIDQYQELIKRIATPTMAIRQNPELAFFIARPDVLYVQLGDLYSRHAQWSEALKSYEAAAAREESDFELKARVARTLSQMGRHPDATKRAVELVGKFHASSDSLALLREVYKKAGRENQAPDDLRRLWEQNPKDRVLLYALADLLKNLGRANDGEAVLKEALARDVEISLVRRVVDFQLARNDVKSATATLIEAAAKAPDLHRELVNYWGELLRTSRNARLRIGDLQKLTVTPSAEPARLFWVAQFAAQWNRDILARTSIESAVKISPPFAPAFRERVDQIASDPTLDVAAKQAAIESLVQLARQQKDEPLALEMSGRGLAIGGKINEAIAEMRQSMKVGNRSPDVYYYCGALLLQTNQVAAFDQLMWKLISDRPTFDQAYFALFNSYFERRSANQALNVLQVWLRNSPDSVNARILQVSVLKGQGQISEAETQVLKLFAEHPDDPQVLNEAYKFYASANRVPEFLVKVENECDAHPDNRSALYFLVNAYASQNRINDAQRLLDDTRRKVATDPDLLYSLAGLYQRINLPEIGESVLEQVLRIDPDNVPANNDLGYNWVDSGRMLDRAEAMIRKAVEAEPDNESFLDSLGWVLYKRGKFEEAHDYLQKAMGSATYPDPVVIDHFADCLYRLKKTEEAITHWKRAANQLKITGATREDLKQLDGQLRQKLAAAERKQAIKVAPTANESGTR